MHLDDATPREWLVGGGDMGQLVRAKNWQSTPLGPLERWPQALRTAVGLVLESKFPMALLWGPKLLLFYNDALRAILVDSHPAALGGSATEVWPALRRRTALVVSTVMEHGETLWLENEHFPIHRRGRLEDACFALSASPVRGEGGAIGGALIVLQEKPSGAASVQAQELERQLAEAQRIARIGHWEWSATTDEVTWSEENFRLAGLEPGRRPPGFAEQHALYSPDSWSRLRTAVGRTLQSGEPYVVDLEIVGAEGTRRWVEARGEAVRGAGGKVVGLRGTTLDITERKEAETALRASEAKYRRLFDNINDPFVIVDMEGRLVEFNRAYEALTGYGPDELKRLTYVDLTPARWQEVEARVVRDQVMTRGFSDVYEKEYRRKDGAVIPVELRTILERDESGRPVSMWAIVRDISARREASERRYRLLFDHMQEGLAYCRMLYVDGRSHDFVYLAVNAAFEALTGLRDVVGKRVSEVLPGVRESDPQLLELFGRVARTGVSERTEFFLAATNAWFSLSVYRPEPEHFVTVFHVITEAKQAAEALRAAARREAEAEALRETDRRKDEFLAMLGHELRNPLAPIRNSLYILNRAPAGGEQARRAQAIIDRQIVHLTRLVDDLLDVSRITRGKVVLQRERLDLCELVRRAVEDHRNAFVDGEVGLEVSTEPEEVWVHGDATRLSQVVGNLLTNAAKFTPMGGKTTVSVLADRARGEAVIRVQDNGRGIEPRLLPRLFEAFTQADTTLDRKKGGLGLGLALVKGLVEMHGGSVRADSAGPDQGATFTIRFPLEAAAPIEVGPGAVTARLPSYRVLVIEDNVDAADSLREVLTLQGHTVEVALTGREGIEKARSFGPDIVLCDIGLPEMDGYEVARTLRRTPELARIRLVALTGYAGPADVAKAKEAGFDAHLAKPPSVEAMEKELHGS